ncbi:uncharacterized protein LOC127753342 [Oryza glaberrima]|uniref:uncharacterized protein LOC127753342 n=1 Tax=Oryza glaberrima TaxID=4538 RepID=UPI00224C4A49|nr:uncharacterized protein LOC127753342 [Oryza glaberrima]
MANHRRQWASWQTFHPVHPMEDLMPGGVRLPDPDEQPPDPIYAFLEVFEELYGDQFPPHVLLYDSGDPNGGDDMVESDDDVDGGGESLSAIVYGGGRLHPSRRPSVPPPEERPRGWMPYPVLPRAGGGHGDADAAAAEQGVEGEGPAGRVAAVLPRPRRRQARGVGGGGQPGALDRVPARPRRREEHLVVEVVRAAVRTVRRRRSLLRRRRHALRHGDLFHVLLPVIGLGTLCTSFNGRVINFSYRIISSIGTIELVAFCK